MPRYKTSDGRIIVVGEVYRVTEGAIYFDQIKSMGSDLFPFSRQTKNGKYTYSFNSDKASDYDFSLIGVGEYKFSFQKYDTDPTCMRVWYGNEWGREPYDATGAIYGNGAAYGPIGQTEFGISPLMSIFVLASEEPGAYSRVFMCMLAVGRDRNFYHFMQFQSFSRLLNFLNNVDNQIAEPDSSPVADENGFFDSGSDAITLPGIDSINVGSALQSSGVKAHKVDITEINKFFGTLWSTDFFDTIIKNQQAPIDNILSLSTYPYDVHDNGTSEEIKVGTVSMGATGKLITAQFQEIDFGSIDCKEYYGNSLDYTYTDVDIFLPFIGTKSLDVNIICGAVISLVYRVDILTGNCDAIISAKRSRDGTELNSVLYIFSGNMQNQIPLTQQQSQALLKLESAIQTAIQGAAMGNPKGGVAGGFAELNTEAMTMALTGQHTTRYQMSGNLSTANGYMGVLTPYLIWYRPVNVKPSGYDKYYGYPSFFTRKLSDCNGYTQIHELISDAPTGVPADDWERIKQMLKDGVIIN